MSEQDFHTRKPINEQYQKYNRIVFLYEQYYSSKTLKNLKDGKLMWKKIILSVF